MSEPVPYADVAVPVWLTESDALGGEQYLRIELLLTACRWTAAVYGTDVIRGAVTTFSTTLELAAHLRTQRMRADPTVTTPAVLADLEAILRASTALPHHNTPLATPEQLVPAIEKAQQIYGHLIARHVTHAQDYLDSSRP